MDMKIYFPGGKQVYADYNSFTHKTDQPVKARGEGTAPAPFDLFLAAIGTCAGYYVLNFCQQRSIDVTGLELTQNIEVDQVKQMISKINIEIKLPADFPEKYKNAVVQAAGLCAVKKHLEDPPQFNVFTS